MDKAQQGEWAAAQKIEFSVDLIEAAKKMLKFLLVVDRNRFLYDESALQWATFRYNFFWLPLLAKHVENPVSDGPLVVPLDCEWVWHCHRLNPLRYKFDCEKLFGKVLDNRNVISSIQATSTSKTEEIWAKMYPEEPYERDLTKPFPGDVLQKVPRNAKFTSYDLVDAIKRQTRFTFQVSRPHTFDEMFLQEAEARYKGFLHLIRTNEKRGIELHCVPTYDIDLIWHTHQLHPDSYSKDDDTIADETKEKQLEAGSFKTTKQWEDMFGLRYWKAGAMHRGIAPTPVTQVPVNFIAEAKELSAAEKSSLSIQFPNLKAVEVFLEFVEIKNVPKEHSGNLSISFSKKQDTLFKSKRSLSILSESAEKQVAYFQCEPTGEFLFELMSSSPSLKLLGSCSLSLQELYSFGSQLWADKWLPFEPVSGLVTSDPILLHASISFTPPMPAPQTFHFARSQLLSMSHTQVVDGDDRDVFSLQMGNMVEDATNQAPDLSNEVYCIKASGEKHKAAEFVGDYWSIKGTQGSYKLYHNSGNGDHLFELVGNKMVKLYAGRRLDFEPKNYVDRRLEQDFMTAVEFSTDHPYGRAVALIDLKSETIKVIDEWIVLPSIALAFILSYTFKGDRQSDESDMASGYENSLAIGGYASHYEPHSGRNSSNVGAAQCFMCLTKTDASIVNEQCDKNGDNVGAARCWCLTKVTSVNMNEQFVKSGNNVGAARCFMCLTKTGPSNVNEQCDMSINNAGAARCWCLTKVTSVNMNEQFVKSGNNVGAARCFMCLTKTGPSNVNEQCDMSSSNAGAARCWCLTKVTSVNMNEQFVESGNNVGAAQCFMCLTKTDPSNVNEQCDMSSNNAGAARCWCLTEVTPIVSEPIAV